MTFIRLVLFFSLPFWLPPMVPAAPVWLTDLPKAQAQARAEGRHVMIHFSGSDWCGWCLKLRKDVFLKPEFESYAGTNLVLVKVDFPKRNTQPAAIQKANQKLAEQFQVKDYPTLILLNPQGAALGKVNYGNGGPKTFIAEVEKIIRPRVEPMPVKAPLKKSDNLSRNAGSPASTNAARAELKLSKITGPRKMRQAVINDQVLSPGQSASIRLAGGIVKVSCLEVRERSAVVSLDGGREKRELRLAGGI